MTLSTGWHRLVKNIGVGQIKILGRKRVAITDEKIGISQLLRARARAVPTPKVYAYDEVKSNGRPNLTLQLYSIPSSHGGNEAEILIIAILWENKFFAISGEDIFGAI